MAPLEGRWSKHPLAGSSGFDQRPLSSSHRAGLPVRIQPRSLCCANPLAGSFLSRLTYPGLLKGEPMFAFLGWYLMPAPLTLG